MMPAANAGVGMNVGFPDVCLTPAAPSPVPVPYPNMGMNSQELPPAGGGKILFSGCPAENQGGKPVSTTGDEGGTANPMFKLAGGCMVGNPKILLGGLPAEHLTTPSFGNNYNDGLGAKLVPSLTNVLLTGLGAAPPEASGLGRWSPAALDLLAAELEERPAPSLGLTLRGGGGGSGGLEVVHVRCGGLGARLGLRPGDVVSHVDGQPLGAAGELPALHEGQEVQLRWSHRGRRREGIAAASTPPAVASRLSAGQVGWLTLRRCSLGAPRQARAALVRLIEAGARGLVLDLRGNPGGCLLSAAELAGAFLNPGAPFAQVRWDTGPAWVQVGGSGPLWEGTLVVLIDGQTASAAEALAAALQDHGRGLLVGRPSFGKGVGELLQLADGGAVPAGLPLALDRIDGRALGRVEPDARRGAALARRLAAGGAR